MKKFLFILMIMIYLSFNLVVYADDEREYTYTLHYEYEAADGSFHDTFHMVFSSDYQYVAYWDTSDGYSYTINYAYYDLSTIEKKDLWLVTENLVKNKAKTYDVSFQTVKNGIVTTNKQNVNGVGDSIIAMWSFAYRSSTTYRPGEDFNTNIPIFQTEDEAIKFIKGELTEKDALNYETDLCKVVYDLEIPQDLKITGFSGDEFNLDFAKIEDVNYKFKWTQTDPEHSKWTTQFYCYEDFKYRLEGFFTSIGEWMYKEDYYLFYDDTDTYRCYWNDYFKKLAEGYVKKEESFGDYDYEILCTKVFVRNAWYDSLEGIQHYSNWIKVDIDFTSGEVTTSFIELGGSEVEKDEDTGSLIIPDDNIIVDSDYTGSDYNGLMIQSSTDLVGWIKNGFGLTGENGVIVLMSETFSFIPPDLWYVFLTGISMFVLIAVVKWVRG